jgi:hypothetical protein
MKDRRWIRLLVIALVVAMPSVTSAASLTSVQMSAVLGLLRAFNVEEALVANVAAALGSTNTAVISSGSPAPAPTKQLVRPDTTGSPYRTGNLGYDLSFNTSAYPPVAPGFIVTGVTAGKAYTYNPRAKSEDTFARVGSSRPTLYLNLNAPYGSTATNERVSTPHTCDVLFGATTTSSLIGGTYPEPTVCAGYNYGYNAAKDAYAYTISIDISSPLWWLDIEEANSWSPNTAVNDAVIQGAIDYLNAQDIRAGVYSMTYMWKMIAGDGFTPTQSLKGKSITTPTWFPIGIATLVDALNACLTHSSFIPDSPVWVIQYVRDSTAVDQNVAC